MNGIIAYLHDTCGLRATEKKTVFDRLDRLLAGMARRRMGLPSSAILAAYYICHDSVSPIEKNDIRDIAYALKNTGVHVSIYNIFQKVNEIRMAFCKHEKAISKIVRLENPSCNDGDDLSILVERIPGELQMHCAKCGTVMARKSVSFLLLDVLRVINRVTATTKNACIIDIVVALENLYYIKSAGNEDERKELSTRYMNFSVLARPLLDLGLIEKKHYKGTYKKIIVTEKGKHALDKYRSLRSRDPIV